MWSGPESCAGVRCFSDAGPSARCDRRGPVPQSERALRHPRPRRCDNHPASEIPPPRPHWPLHPGGYAFLHFPPISAADDSRGFPPGRKRGSRGKLLTNDSKKLTAAAARERRAAGECSDGGPEVALGEAAAPLVGGGPVAFSRAAKGTDALSLFRATVGPTEVDMRKNLLLSRPGYLIHRSAVPSGMCVRVFRIVAGLESHIIFNYKTVDDFERNGTTVETIIAPGGGDRIMAKLGGLVLGWLGATRNDIGPSKAGILPDAQAQLWADFCMVAVVFMVFAGEAYVHGGYQCVYGPSLLQIRGECPAQIPLIDQSAPVDRQGRAKKFLRATSRTCRFWSIFKMARASSSFYTRIGTSPSCRFDAYP